jgi:hypothetical protein
MYNLPEGSAQGRMPGAGSVQPTFKAIDVPVSVCIGCVNYTPRCPFDLNGPAGHCDEVCPGPKKILVRA